MLHVKSESTESEEHLTLEPLPESKAPPLLSTIPSPLPKILICSSVKDEFCKNPKPLIDSIKPEPVDPDPILPKVDPTSLLLPPSLFLSSIVRLTSSSEGFIEPFADTVHSELFDQKHSASDIVRDSSALSTTTFAVPPHLFPHASYFHYFDENRPSVGHVCAACRQDIVDPFYLRVHPNMEYHSGCLKCAECQRFLDESTTTFVKEGNTYCKEDYYRRFGRKCARCQQPCMKQDMVIRARHLTFHCSCFSCFACERHLRTGETFTVRGDGVFCSPECPVGLSLPLPSSLPLPTSTSLPVTTPSVVQPLPVTQTALLPQQPCSSVTLEPRPSSLSNTGFDDDSWETSTVASGDGQLTPLRSPKSDEGAGPSTSTSSKKNKKDKQTTRVRTVLNEQQLAILKKCYAMNSRPDALLKEHLVEATGLNARVIRVWFQNKRCKDKKRQIQMRDMQVNAEKEAVLNGIRVHGVGPLIVSSPTTHVDNLGPPLEIHQFAQWSEHRPPPHIDPAFHQHAMSAFGGDGFVGAAQGLPIGFDAPPFGDFSPHLHQNELRSPACTE